MFVDLFLWGSRAAESSVTMRMIKVRVVVHQNDFKEVRPRAPLSVSMCNVAANVPIASIDQAERQDICNNLVFSLYRKVFITHIFFV